MIELWNKLPENKKQSVKNLVTRKYWKLLFDRYGELLDLKDAKEAKTFGLYMLECDFHPVAHESQYEHDKNYWYDPTRGVYVLHLPSKKRPFVLKRTTWESMKEAYSNWDGEPASVNELCRKFSMARTTVQEILRAMGMTHDGALWSNDHAISTSDSDLVDDLLQRKLNSVLVKAEKLEWSRVKRDARKWRRAEFVADEISSRMKQTGVDYSVETLNIKKAASEFSVIISPTDYHWGMYGPSYTGEPYNRQIARKRLFEATEELLGRITERGRPDKIILALGGDSLHFDNYHRKTTHGTIQDTDGTPEEIAWSWVELCRDYVDAVRQVAPVELFVIPGNHDRFSAVFLRAAMKGWFSQIDSVEVVECLGPRQYTKYGKSMITFMHGDQGSTKDWPAIIAGEEPRLWGQCDHRFIFTGHLHTERELPSFGNVTVYRMPSLAGTDNWHYGCGYKSRKALIAYIIDSEKGVITTEIEPVN